MEQTANDVDQVKRSSSLDHISADLDPYASFQRTKCARASTNGSPHQIRLQIITLRVVLTTKSQQFGSLEETFTRNGNQRDRSFGLTESVRPVPIYHAIPFDDGHDIVAGSGKSILWFVHLQLYPSPIIDVSY